VSVDGGPDGGPNPGVGASPDELAAIVRERTVGAARALASIDAQAAEVAALMAAVLDCLRAGGTVFTCGNGGSAAEALHLAEELVGFYRDHTRPARRAICLAADPTALTCIANDAGFEHVFSRPLGVLGRPGDLLVGLTTSGNSANVVRALETARAGGMLTAGLLGGDGGRARAHCDHAIVVDAPDTGSVQEGHLVLVHLICEAVERDAAANG
jgi:D-sedoheptulose 7-phosphate isomerase